MLPLGSSWLELIYIAIELLCFDVEELKLTRLQVLPLPLADVSCQDLWHLDEDGRWDPMTSFYQLLD